MRPLRVALALSLALWTCLGLAQVQTPLHVEAFGGEQQRLPPIKVPTELTEFIPKGFVLRAAIQTKMWHEGETLFLYDNDAETFPEVHLHALRRNGKELNLYDGTLADIAGLLPLQLRKGKQAVAFAYHVGFDEADTTFIVFTADADSYRAIFERKTTSGQMRVLRMAPLTFQIWSADWKLDRGDSCVWCPHRYRIQTYLLRDNNFELIRRSVTSAALSPDEIAGKPFVISKAGN